MSCKREIESFAKNGQLIPALGRPVVGDPDFDVELIYGARRLFVARHLNIPLSVEVKQLTDKEGLIAVDTENRLRMDVSAYERGRCYGRWLRGKHFGSQEEIASFLQISNSQVSRLLRISRLPTVIIGAFASATDICETWGLALAEGWEDAQRQPAMARGARAIGQLDPRPPAEQIYRELLGARVGQRKSDAADHDKVILDCNGSPLFRVRRHRDSVSIVLAVAKTPDIALQNVVAAVRRTLLEQAMAPANELRKPIPPSAAQRIGVLTPTPTRSAAGVSAA